MLPARRAYGTVRRTPHKTSDMKTLRVLLACPFLAAIPACNTVTTDTGTSATVQQGVPGGEFVRTEWLEATVTDIDYSKRKVTLLSAHREKFEVEAGPEVVNFNRIRVGDPLTIVLKETFLVRMAKPGEKLDEEVSTTAELARLGAKPGARVTETERYVATVTAIDTAKRTATLKFSDGSSGKFDVRPDVDLSQRRVGEKVLMQSTTTLAVSMSRS